MPDYRFLYDGDTPSPTLRLPPAPQVQPTLRVPPAPQVQPTLDPKSILIRDIYSLIQNNGNIREIRRKLDELDDLDTINVRYDNRTPLIEAVRFNRTEICKLLIDLRIDVNYSDRSGRVPLFYAGNLEIANLLIRAGASVDKIINGYNIASMIITQDVMDLVKKTQDEYEALNNNNIEDVVVSSTESELLKKTFHDYVMIEDIGVEEFLKDDPSNKIFIYNNSIYGVGKSVIDNYLADENKKYDNTFVECNEPTPPSSPPKLHTVDTKNMYFSLKNFIMVVEGFVLLKKLIDVLKSNDRVFILEPERVLGHMASIQTTSRNPYIMSAFHCQEGTEGLTLYKIKKVSFKPEESSVPVQIEEPRFSLQNPEQIRRSRSRDRNPNRRREMDRRSRSRSRDRNPNISREMNRRSRSRSRERDRTPEQSDRTSDRRRDRTPEHRYPRRGGYKKSKTSKKRNGKKRIYNKTKSMPK
jgi:hypothetical protein